MDICPKWGHSDDGKLCCVWGYYVDAEIYLEEKCSDKRKKRSIDHVTGKIMSNSNYTRMYSELIGIPALDVFFNHDLDQVSSFVLI